MLVSSPAPFSRLKIRAEDVVIYYRGNPSWRSPNDRDITPYPIWACTHDFRRMWSLDTTLARLLRPARD